MVAVGLFREYIKKIAWVFYKTVVHVKKGMFQSERTISGP